MIIVSKQIKIGGLVVLCSQMSACLRAESVQLINGLKTPLYAAIYYVKDSGITRSGEVVVINQSSQASVEKPSLKLFNDRDLVVSASSADLTPSLTREQYLALPHTNVGTLTRFTKGNEIVCYDDNGSIKLIQSGGLVGLMSQAKEAVFTGLVTPIRILIKRDQDAINANPYRLQVGSVRFGRELSDKEKAFQSARDQKTRQAFSRYLDIPYEQLAGKALPRIGIVCSGGGFRAMISTLGFLSASEKIGLINMTTYVAGLSGSTWAIGSWMSYGKSLEQTKQILLSKIPKKITDFSKSDTKLAIDSVLVRFAYDKPFTLVDVFGLALSNRFFEDFGVYKQRVYLSDQYNFIKNGDVPFPVYSAVEGRLDASLPITWLSQDGGASSNKPWFEFNPVEVGTAEYNGAYVPAEFFGREFMNGSTINDAPGITMGKVLAICGSAFAVAQKELWEKIAKSIDNPLVKSYFLGFLQASGIHAKYSEQSLMLTQGEEDNPLQGVPGPLSQEPIISLKDAGLGHTNLAYPLLSGERPGRECDILFFFDSSASLASGEAKEFKKAEKYARLRGLSFPVINYENLATRTMTVFKSDDPKVPTVVYMPIYNDAQLLASLVPNQLFSRFSTLQGFDVGACIAKDFCSTFNFSWKHEEATRLSQLTEFNILANELAIKEVIRQVVQRKLGL